MADGPLEMLYTLLNLLSLGFEVTGVDWNNKPGTNFLVRDNRIKGSKRHEKVLFT